MFQVAIFIEVRNSFILGRFAEVSMVRSTALPATDVISETKPVRTRFANRKGPNLSGEGHMKTFLLTGVATLFLVGSASAQAVVVETGHPHHHWHHHHREVIVVPRHHYHHHHHYVVLEHDRYGYHHHHHHYYDDDDDNM